MESTTHELVIGVSLPKTGRYAGKAGRFYERAYDLWRDDVNRRGGLLGRTVQLLVYDDASTPEKAAENYRRLIHEDRVPLLLGPCHSALVEAAAPVVEGARRLLLQGSGSSHEIFRRGRKYLFLCWAGCDFDYPKSFFELIARSRGTDRPWSAALAYTDGRIGRAVALGVKHYAPLYGCHLAFEEVIERPPFDYRAFMQRIKAQAPNAVLIGLDHTRPDNPMHSCVLEAERAGWKPNALWLSDNPSPEDIELGGAIDGAFMRATWVPVDPSPLSQHFARAFTDAYGVEPEYHSAGGYASCQVLEQAVEATGSLDSETLRQALLQRPFETVMGELRFGENGLSAGPMKLCQWQQGKLAIVYPNAERTAAPIL